MTDNTTEPRLVSMRDVRFRYTSRSPWLLQGVDLDVARGDRVGVVGDNGAGKSTVAKLLLGLCPPSSGRVHLFGRSASWRTHYPDLGYIGDPSYNKGEMALPPEVEVGRLLDAYAELFAGSNRSLPHAEQLKAGLGLDEPRLRRNTVGRLNKGHRQRLMAFFALAKAPAFLLADEATEGLDAESRQLVLTQVAAVAARDDMAMLWISHNFAEIGLLTHRVCELRDGKLTTRGALGFDFAVEADGVRTAHRRIPASTVLNIVGKMLLSANSICLQLERRHDNDVVA